MTFEDFKVWVWSNNFFVDIELEDDEIHFHHEKLNHYFYISKDRIELNIDGRTYFKFKTFEDIINVINALNKSI